MNQVLELMFNHRSIRKYSDKLISDSDVSLIIKAAQSAATSSFLQAYTIIEVRDVTLRSKLKPLCGDQDYVEEAPLFFVFCADLHRIKLICEMDANASDKTTVTTYEPGWTESFIIATVDAALAAQNALLAAESMGMGGVYIGGIRNNAQTVSDLLGLPEEVYPVFGMCIGYPAQDPAVKERLPQPLIHHIDRYGELDMTELKAYDARISTYYHHRSGGKNSDTWTKSVSKKFAGEKREHMKAFLEKRGFNKR